LQGKGVREDDFLIGIHPGANYPTKKWPLERFIRLASLLLQKRKIKVLFFRDLNDAYYEQKLEGFLDERFILEPETSVGRLCGLIECCNLFISNDGGPKHAAVALDIPTVTIFGPQNERVWNPPGNSKHLTVRMEGLACAPCNKKICPRGTYACMQLLPVEEVYNVAKKLLPKM